MSIKKNDKLKFIIFIMIILIAITFIILNWKTIRHLGIENVVGFVKTKGSYAVAIYLLIFALKPFVIIIPSNMLVICGGIVFGPFKGILLAMIGFWISATVAFYISRFLGKDFVQQIIGSKFINLEKKLENNQTKIVFFLRLMPIVPYDPLSYICGFSNMGYFIYAVISVFGVLPEVFCYNLIGKNVSNPLSIQFLAPLAIVFIIALFSRKLFNLNEQK